MTIDEAIERYKNNAEYERTHGNLQGCLEFRQLAKWLEKYKKIEEIVNHRESYLRGEIKGFGTSHYMRMISEVVNNG